MNELPGYFSHLLNWLTHFQMLFSLNLGSTFISAFSVYWKDLFPTPCLLCISSFSCKYFCFKNQNEVLCFRSFTLPEFLLTTNLVPFHLESLSLPHLFPLLFFPTSTLLLFLPLIIFLCSFCLSFPITHDCKEDSIADTFSLYHFHNRRVIPIGKKT